MKKIIANTKYKLAKIKLKTKTIKIRPTLKRGNGKVVKSADNFFFQNRSKIFLMAKINNIIYIWISLIVSYIRI